MLVWHFYTCMCDLSTQPHHKTLWSDRRSTCRERTVQHGLNSQDRRSQPYTTLADLHRHLWMHVGEYIQGAVSQRETLKSLQDKLGNPELYWPETWLVSCCRLWLWDGGRKSVQQQHCASSKKSCRAAETGGQPGKDQGENTNKIFFSAQGLF